MYLVQECFFRGSATPREGGGENDEVSTYVSRCVLHLPYRRPAKLETRPLHVAPFGLISGGLLISQTIYDFLIGDPNIILFVFSC